MCDGKCCNDLGSSPQAQLLYVCVCITYAVVASASLLLNIVAEDHVELLEWIINLILLAVFVTWIVILSSRCCAPCCCGPQMPDVPQPCPVGPLSCENLPLLDYPMLIAFGGEFLTGFLVALVYSITDGFLNPRDRDVAGTARLISVAWIALAVVGAATGLRKFRLMRERPPSVPVGTPVVGTPHNQVVGAPIAGKVVN